MDSSCPLILSSLDLYTITWSGTDLVRNTYVLDCVQILDDFSFCCCSWRYRRICGRGKGCQAVCGKRGHQVWWERYIMLHVLWKHPERSSISSGQHLRLALSSLGDTWQLQDSECQNPTTKYSCGRKLWSFNAWLDLHRSLRYSTHTCRLESPYVTILMQENVNFLLWYLLALWPLAWRLGPSFSILVCFWVNKR